MSLKRRIEKLENETRNRPEPQELFDFVVDYKDGQPPITVKVTRKFLDNVERCYGPEAEARRAQLRSGHQPNT